MGGLGDLFLKKSIRIENEINYISKLIYKFVFDLSSVHNFIYIP